MVSIALSTGQLGSEHAFVPWMHIGMHIGMPISSSLDQRGLARGFQSQHTMASSEGERPVIILASWRGTVFTRVR